jgi:hypothetical protein
MQSNKNENRGTKIEMPPLDAEAIARLIAPNTVYVREVGVDELKGSGVLPVDVSVPETQKFFALHLADGRRVAVMDDRELAFAAARQHDLEPVSVH